MARSHVLCLRRLSRRAPAVLGLGLLLAAAPALAAEPNPPAPVAERLTLAAQLRHAAAQPGPALYSVRLEGIVLWTNAAQDQVILQDDSGGVALNLDLRAQPSLHPGQRVLVEGGCLAGNGAVREVLIDNDGAHPQQTRTETVWLQAGRHPLRVAWFNGSGEAKLQLEYAGPGLPRQPLSAAVLSHRERAAPMVAPVPTPGLTFAAYEGVWERLPVLAGLTPVRTGTVAQLDLSVRSREEDVGLVFEGWLAVVREGAYTFWLTSDDGSCLYVGDCRLRLEPRSQGAWPRPRPLNPGQRLDPRDEHGWGEIEGRVTFIRQAPAGGAELQVVSGTNLLYLSVQGAAGPLPRLFSRLRAAGVIRRVGPLEHATAGALLVPDRAQLVELEPGGFSANFIPTTVGRLHRWAANGRRTAAAVQLEGRILAVSSSGQTLVFADDSGAALMNLGPDQARLRAGQEVRLRGTCTLDGAHLDWRPIPLVDNDGIHQRTERSGSVLLTAGRHPFRVTWMNREVPAILDIAVTGPDGVRRQLGELPLTHPVWDAAGERWVGGVNYRAFEGSWEGLPEFSQCAVVRQGTAADLELSCASRSNEVGLEFSGYLEVPQAGAYLFSTASDDGSQMWVDSRPLEVEVLGSALVPPARRLAAGQSLRPTEAGEWAEANGIVTFVTQSAEGLELELSSGTGYLHVEVAERGGLTPLRLLNSRIQVKGVCRSTFTADGQTVGGTLLVPGSGQVRLVEVAALTRDDPSGAPLTHATARPVLTTVEQVKSLSREEAQSGYPVKIRGVVTTPLDGGFFIQDHTWGIYCRCPSLAGGELPRIGDYWEVEGETFAEFPPNILAHRALRLGPGTLPEPLRPTWDQLINGSLDTQYIEVQGIVAGVDSGAVTLLTRAGKLRVELPELPVATLRQYENALIRVRGCVIPGRNAATQQVELGQMRLSSVSVNVDEPPPADLFAAPLKHAADLLLFDARAGAFQRVRLAGQVLHQRGAEIFLANGTNGLRFTPKSPLTLAAGDLVEVVGFPELGGPSPVLREASVRPHGRAPLPGPRHLSEPELLRRQHDATLVCVQSRLVNLSVDRGELVLQLQSGARGFVARLRRPGGTLPRLVPGSRLELTGVYAGQGGDTVAGRDIDSFELLLNSQAAIRVLEQAPWWTLRHTVTVVGGMALAMVAALVWISLLRRQVEERSHQLASEVRRHEQTQRQRALEEERSRIAQDLHDDLGATLTQIKLLATLQSRDVQVPETARSRMCQISEKSRAMVTSLDEIVWAVNPANDSLPSLATYLCQFAEEFFRASKVRCRLDVADTLPAVPLSSEVRHHLYLAVREALNNIAKHAQATEVWLRIHWQDGGLDIRLEDNGRGFTAAAVPGDGLANMRRRLTSIGGLFACDSLSGKGTVCRIHLPLA